MLTLNMLGHVYVTHNGHSVQVSHKGAALLSYLALERQAHHREHLADLLWDHPQALRNLRVELTRLKQQGISPFPARQPMLSLNCATDLEQWTQDSGTLTESNLPGWLARARGFPLSGLEDVGSVTFRTWVDQQRWRISENMERTLADVYARFSGRGQMQSLNLIRERADRLGFRLPETPGPPPEGKLFQHPPQQAELQRVAHKAQAEYRSQLVFLHGQPGTAHPLISAAFQDTPWQVMQIQMGAQRRLVQGALIQQLVRTIPEYKAPLLDLLGDLTEEGELDLIRISALIARAGSPLVLAVHVTENQPWLTNAVRFVLDFPHPMVLVMCTSADTVRRELQAELGGVDRAQLHTLNIPAVGSRAVQHAMQRQGQPCTASQASRWAQCTEGWPLYFQTFWERGELPEHRCPAQPEVITHAVLNTLNGVPAPARRQFSRLAQIQDRFDMNQAAYVLEEPELSAVMNLLRLGRAHDLLVPAAEREAVRLSTLSTWVNDVETHLTFASETVRVALATQLPAPERHHLRIRLSEYYQHRCPALHQHYAARAGLPVTPPVPARQPAPAPTAEPQVSEWPTWQTVPDDPALQPPGARQELRTPNGYRVALEGSTLEVMRKGYLGSAPTLALPFGPLPAGTWRMRVRIDLLRNFTTEPRPYALGIGHDGHLQTTFTAHTGPGDLPTERDVLPAQQWILLTGTSPGGQFEITVRAMDVALSISELTWNGQSLLCPPPALLA